MRNAHDVAMGRLAAILDAGAVEYDADSLYRHHVTGWTDGTVPRTDAPMRFVRGACVVYRGGAPVRVARMGMRSRVEVAK